MGGELSRESPVAGTTSLATLAHPRAAAFWLAVIATGAGTGGAAIALTRLLEAVQRLAWPAAPGILEAAARGAAARHLLVLMAAGLLTAVGQLLLGRLTSGNGIETTTAIWFMAGRVPALRTLGSAVLSVIVVGMGASLGREGAPKQAGAVLANVLSDRARFSDEQRRLLVACGAGAGLAAAYGVPVGGALFAIEVMRGVLALRMVLPALVAAVVATLVARLALPDLPTYVVPAYPASASLLLWAAAAGPIAGIAAVGFVRLIARADRAKPHGAGRFLAPIFALAALGALSILFPQLLGNGHDVTQLAIAGQLALPLLLFLLFLKPAATVGCLGSGVPGGLLTPSLTVGAMLGGALGTAWSWWWPGVAPGACALIGAGAFLAATTQGPLSATVLVMELTGQARGLMLPLLLAVATATLISRTLDVRSIYDARLSQQQLRERQRLREQPPGSG